MSVLVLYEWDGSVGGYGSVHCCRNLDRGGWWRRKKKMWDVEERRRMVKEGSVFLSVCVCVQGWSR